MLLLILYGCAVTVMQAACFARLAGSDPAMLRTTFSMAERALQLQPDNPHYVSGSVCSSWTSMMADFVHQHAPARCPGGFVGRRLLWVLNVRPQLQHF
jgi:hypothetical protein